MPLNMLSTTSFSYLLLLLCSFIHSFPSLSLAIYFNFPHFEPGTTNNITCEGYAIITDDRLLELNKMRSFVVGRATYSKPIQLWDSSTGKLTDFTTLFSFTIDIYDSNITSDGFAFYLAPLGYQIPPNSMGGYLGLFNDTTYLATDQNQIVMVEFDTFSNYKWDAPEQHVGININSITSVAYVKWNASARTGKLADVSISYNAIEKNLSVSWSYREDQSVGSNRNNISYLSYILDLKEILPELVTIGFSSATGSFGETNSINSWEFNSSLDIINNKKTIISTTKMNKKVIAVIILAIALCSFFVVLVYVGICWKKRKEKNNMSSIELERESLPKRFSYKVLLKATNGFAENNRLGQGGSGEVFKGSLSGFGCLVAVKRIFAEPQTSERIFKNEAKIISRLIHRNLVQFIGWCHEQDKFLLVYEYMHNGSLDTHLFGNRKCLPWNSRYQIALGLASALQYLHEDAEQCVLHRDIKSANVLLDKDFSTKLGDFGVAKLVDPRLRTIQKTQVVVGTYGYLAPEYVKERRATKESDMYSFGVVALEIASGKRTYEIEGYHVPLRTWIWELYLAGNLLQAADESLNMDFVDNNEMEILLIVGLWCTHPNQNKRPKAGQVIQILQLDLPLPELPRDLATQSTCTPQQNQNVDFSQATITCSINSVGR